MSTEEELHQVLAVLDEFARDGWTLPPEDTSGPRPSGFWTDTALLNNSEAADSLAELLLKRPELKN